MPSLQGMVVCCTIMLLLVILFCTGSVSVGLILLLFLPAPSLLLAHCFLCGYMPIRQFMSKKVELKETHYVFHPHLAVVTSGSDDVTMVTSGCGDVTMVTSLALSPW